METGNRKLHTLKALSNSAVVETESKEEFDQLARIASFVSKTPIAMISFVDDNREWFKSITGINTSFREVDLEKSFGLQVIAHKGEMLHIENPHEDVRTRNNPMIRSFEEIGMIAGIPIEDEEGERFGALSVVAYKDRDLSFEQISSLKTIASQITILVKLKNALKEIEDMLSVYDGRKGDGEFPKPEMRFGDDRFKNEGMTEKPYEKAIKSDFMSSLEMYKPGTMDEENTDKNIAGLRILKNLLIHICEMGELFQASNSVDDINTITMKYAELLFPDCSGSLYMLNESTHQYEIYSSWGKGSATEQYFLTDDCWAVRLGRLHIASSTGSSLCCDHVPQSEPVEYICAPFVASGRVSGLLYLQRDVSVDGTGVNNSEGLLDNTQQLIVSKMAKLAGLSIGNIRHKETLGIHAVFDSLTGLYNRRYMEETLKRELSRASRRKEPLGLIMMDVDHFKSFNDTYGHSAGDNLLRSIGKFLMESIRREDIACRYGGEEFVLILPGCSLEHTVRRAEQIKEDIKKVRIWNRGRSIDCVNVSMGIGLFSEHGDSMETLLESADRALYEAKNKGRDRIEIASSPGH